VEGRCDDDGAELIARDDDREATIRQRLSAYRELTGPILQWYGEAAVRRVDGGRAPDVVAKDVERVVLEASLQSCATT
jgi:adenylate kinase